MLFLALFLALLLALSLPLLPLHQAHIRTRRVQQHHCSGTSEHVFTSLTFKIRLCTSYSNVSSSILLSPSITSKPHATTTASSFLSSIAALLPNSYSRQRPSLSSPLPLFPLIRNDKHCCFQYVTPTPTRDSNPFHSSLPYLGRAVQDPFNDRHRLSSDEDDYYKRSAKLEEEKGLPS